MTITIVQSIPGCYEVILDYGARKKADNFKELVAILADATGAPSTYQSRDELEAAVEEVLEDVLEDRIDIDRIKHKLKNKLTDMIATP